jgi:hypothetical protein
MATDADEINIFLDRCIHYLFGGLVQAKIDYLESGIAIRPGNHFSAPVVPIKPWFGYQYPEFSLWFHQISRQDRNSQSGTILFPV